MKQETTVSYYCPKCNSKVAVGERKFGPARVQCKKCGEVFTTGLTEWSQLSAGRKLSIVIMQIINPLNCNNIFTWFIYTFILIGIFCLPVIAIASIFRTVDNNFLEAIVFPLGTLLMEIFFFFFAFAKHVGESNKYSKTQAPPVWGK